MLCLNQLSLFMEGINTAALLVTLENPWGSCSLLVRGMRLLQNGIIVNVWVGSRVRLGESSWFESIILAKAKRSLRFITSLVVLWDLILLLQVTLVLLIVVIHDRLK